MKLRERVKSGKLHPDEALAEINRMPIRPPASLVNWVVRKHKRATGEECIEELLTEEPENDHPNWWGPLP